ncbi:hypothetical protein EV44_g2352 [Erysiphe necator]|uniref:Uncharacterized protein n=1 Tax=Uncinula necator TaxID=52586 RepID=A0A0B1NVA4_UNCNE|nr:hypothetical protein EV44_g2352 [Erysiphe necator]
MPSRAYWAFTPASREGDDFDFAGWGPLCLKARHTYTSVSIYLPMPHSQPLSSSNATTSPHLITHLKEPLALHYLSSPANQTKAIFGCVAAGKNPPKTTGCGAPLVPTSGLNPKT